MLKGIIQKDDLHLHAFALLYLNDQDKVINNFSLSTISLSEEDKK